MENTFKKFILNFSKDLVHNLNNNPKMDINKEMESDIRRLEKGVKESLGLNLIIVFTNKDYDLMRYEQSLTVLSELKEYFKNKNVSIFSFSMADKIADLLNDINSLKDIKSIIDDYRPVSKPNKSVIMTDYDKQVLFIDIAPLIKYNFDSNTLAAIMVKAIAEVLAITITTADKLKMASEILGEVIEYKSGKIDDLTFKDSITKYLNTVPDNDKNLIKELLSELLDIKEDILTNVNEISMWLLSKTELTEDYVRLKKQYAKDKIFDSDKNGLYVLKLLTDVTVWIWFYALVGILSIVLLIPVAGIAIFLVGYQILKLVKNLMLTINDAILSFISIALFGRISSKYEKIAKELEEFKRYNIQILRLAKDKHLSKDARQSIERTVLVTYEELKSLLNEYPKLKKENQYPFTDEGITNLLNDSIKELENNDLYILNLKLRNN